MVTTDEPRPAAKADLNSDGLERHVGFFGLLWSSEGSIIGSGWLFGALTAATIAGPSAIFSWVIMSVIIIVLALIHAELGGLFPVSGGSSRFPHYAFGSLAGAVFGWFAYIQAATVAPIEVLAAIQYMSTASWAKGFYSSSGSLTASGIVVAVILMVFFVAVNVIGVSWLARVNNALTIWKVGLPILAVIVLMITSFHSGNFSAGGGFYVKGAELKSIFVAIPAGGIVFSLLGFEQAAQLAGEAKDPKKDLPRAIIMSILLGSAIYILAQIAFIAALDPHLFAHGTTWADLANPKHSATVKALNAAPFYKVASLAGLAWLAFLLRLDAVVSPAGTGLIYLTSGSRIGFGLSKNGSVPVVFEKASGRSKVPVFGILFTAAIGLLFLLPFPAWNKLVGVVTVASILMYAGAPLALGALRGQKPNLERAYRLPAASILAPVGFILANYVIMWAGWPTYSTMIVVMIIGLLLMGSSIAFKLNPNTPRMDWGAAIWIVPYLVGMGFITYLDSYVGQSDNGAAIGGIGPFKDVLVGGKGHLGFGWDFLVVAIFSLAIYYLAMRTRLPEAKVDHYVREVYPPPEGGH
ncbi:APC family permease [uncultured Jatrophihabitans sp.]|uniref:APC family permease n=1 Tax=uncultured Jatrophihabitans sp. TaxID=1610747 RepID=UPI0035CB0CA5